MATSDCDRKERSSSDTEMDNASRTSSLVSNAEYFVSKKHAVLSLGKMESYFLKEQLTDVVLIAGKRRIPAHRLVLSAGSAYFAAMFTNNMKEASQSEIEMHVDGDALWALMLYCYTGTIELFEDTLETVFVTARLLQLNEVVDACCSFLKNQLDPSNCIGIRLFADSQGCNELCEAAQNYTAEHFLEVIKNQEYLMLSADEVAKLLASDDLNVPSEETIFNAFMSWVEYSLPNRTEQISKLLSLVKLPLLSPSFIVDHIETIPQVRHSPECRELIVEAFKYHLLPDRRSMLQSPRTCPRKSTAGDMYAWGGTGPEKCVISIEKYNMRLDKWTHYDNMGSKRLQCGVAVVDGKICVVGGRDGLKTLNTIECYDIKTKTRKSMPPMSTPRHGLGVAVLEGPLYAVGGHDGWSFLNTVERWDPQTKAWSYIAPMLSQRSTVGVAVLSGKLYAVGGRDGSSCLSSVECYDPHTNIWSACAPMAKRRGGVGVGVLNGFLYALGGHEVPGINPSYTRFNCVERYDPRTDSWTTIASMSCGRDLIGVCVLGEKLFAVGGYDGKMYLNLVEAYDPQKNEWQTTAALINPRACAGMVVIRAT